MTTDTSADIMDGTPSVPRDEASAFGELTTMVSSAAALLRMVSQEDVLSLSQRFPDQRDILVTPGRLLGGTGASKQFVVDVWTAALEKGSAECRRRAPRIGRKLSRSGNLALASQLIAASASVTLAGMLAQSVGGRVAPIVLASIAAAGSAAAIVSKAMNTVPGGGTLDQHYVKLRSLAAEAHVVALGLRTWAAARGRPKEQGDKLIGRAVELVREMNEVLGLA